MGESNDKGLADMETGSEVYMSELLVSENMAFYFLQNLFQKLVLQNLSDNLCVLFV